MPPQLARAQDLPCFLHLFILWQVFRICKQLFCHRLCSLSWKLHHTRASIYTREWTDIYWRLEQSSAFGRIVHALHAFFGLVGRKFTQSPQRVGACGVTHTHTQRHKTRVKCFLLYTTVVFWSTALVSLWNMLVLVVVFGRSAIDVGWDKGTLSIDILHLFLADFFNASACLCVDVGVSLCDYVFDFFLMSRLTSMWVHTCTFIFGIHLFCVNRPLPIDCIILNLEIRGECSPIYIYIPSILFYIVSWDVGYIAHCGSLPHAGGSGPESHIFLDDILDTNNTRIHTEGRKNKQQIAHQCACSNDCFGHTVHF